MSYIILGLTEREQGPFPHKEGECCGTIDRRKVTLSSDKTTLVERLSFKALRIDAARFRIGAYSSGCCVSVCLVEDQPLKEDEKEIDTDMFDEAVILGIRPAQKPYKANCGL